MSLLFYRNWYRWVWENFTISINFLKKSFTFCTTPLRTNLLQFTPYVSWCGLKWFFGGYLIILWFICNHQSFETVTRNFLFVCVQIGKKSAFISNPVPCVVILSVIPLLMHVLSTVAIFLIMQLKANDTVEVEYVDYGTDEIIPVRDLRRNVALLDMPIQCYKFPIRSDVTPVSIAVKNWKNLHISLGLLSALNEL